MPRWIFHTNGQFSGCILRRLVRACRPPCLGTRKLRNRYGDIPIWGTESGWSDGLDTALSSKQDSGRMTYYHSYIYEMNNAIHQDGVKPPGLSYTVIPQPLRLKICSTSGLSICFVGPGSLTLRLRMESFMSWSLMAA